MHSRLAQSTLNHVILGLHKDIHRSWAAQCKCSARAQTISPKSLQQIQLKVQDFRSYLQKDTAENRSRGILCLRGHQGFAKITSRFHILSNKSGGNGRHSTSLTYGLSTWTADDIGANALPESITRTFAWYQSASATLWTLLQQT